MEPSIQSVKSIDVRSKEEEVCTACHHDSHYVRDGDATFRVRYSNRTKHLSRLLVVKSLAHDPGIPPPS